MLFLLPSIAHHLLDKMCPSVHCNKASDSSGTDSSVVDTDHGGQQMPKATCMAEDRVSQDRLYLGVCLEMSVHSGTPLYKELT